MARGKYNFVEGEAERWISFFQNIIDSFALDKEKQEQDGFNLVYHNLSPANVCDILEDHLGWSQTAFDTNGWEADTWITFHHKEYDFGIVVYYTGYTFDFGIRPEVT